MVLAEIKNAEINNKGKELTSEQIVDVIAKEAKKRKDSIEAYASAGRDDLKEQEEKELVILKEFLPEQLTEDEVKKIVEAKIAELNIVDKSEMGKLMGAVMPEVKGRADGNIVKKAVAELLK